MITEGCLKQRCRNEKTSHTRLIVNLIKVTAMHKDYQLTNYAARDLAILMRQQFGRNVLGPEYPTVARIKNKFLKHILLKIEVGSSIQQIKIQLQYFIEQLNKNKVYKSVRFVLDVDPV